MKQETYRKMSESVKKFRHGTSIIKYGNDLLTGIIYVAFLVLLAVMFFHKEERIWRVVLVCGISFVLVSLFRYFYDEKRPYVLYDFEPVVKKNKAGQSMPSRHVFSGFVIGMAFLYVAPLWSGLIFLCATLMCFGRVVAGVHFPKDVIVGALIGIFSGIIGFWMI